MTSDEIFAVYKNWDTPTPECESRVLKMSPNTTTDVAILRATLEVAYQLAMLNEGFESLTSRRGLAHLRVQVEPGDYPLKVKTHEGR